MPAEIDASCGGHPQRLLPVPRRRVPATATRCSGGRPCVRRAPVAGVRFGSRRALSRPRHLLDARSTATAGRTGIRLVTDSAKRRTPGAVVLVVGLTGKRDRGDLSVAPVRPDDRRHGVRCRDVRASRTPTDRSGSVAAVRAADAASSQGAAAFPMAPCQPPTHQGTSAVTAAAVSSPRPDPRARRDSSRPTPATSTTRSSSPSSARTGPVGQAEPDLPCRAPEPRRRRADLPQARGTCNHTGRAQGQQHHRPGLLGARMGKPRVIAETGAGQHGVATATIARATAGMRGVHGQRDVKRQS